MRDQFANIHSVAPGTSVSPWIAPQRRLQSTAPAVGNQTWLVLLCFVLLGYAVCGKGWAYVTPPLFIGELALLAGAISLLIFGRWRELFDLPTVWLLVLLAAWGSYRTLPYLPGYRSDALRDAAIWGYGAFAVLVFSHLLARPESLAMVLGMYRRFCGAFLLLMPLVWFLCRWFDHAIPTLPWVDEPVIAMKGGDALVHLSGVMAFLVVGIGPPSGRWRMLMLACCVAMAGAYNRGGLVAFMMVFGLCLLLRPLNRSLWRLSFLAACGLLVLAVVDVRFHVPGKKRDVSIDQLATNLWSVVGDSEDHLDGTKAWRLAWWGKIVDYTVGGRYFWKGKGFGINLADDDGFQGTQWEGKLRSPHNGHLTMLARGGVPGMVLWLLVQLSWAWGMFRSYLASRRSGLRQWSGVFLFLLGYWVAFMVNASFDVFIEGPMGGIWFWCIFGVGLGAMWIYRHAPEVLQGPEWADQQATTTARG